MRATAGCCGLRRCFDLSFCWCIGECTSLTLVKVPHLILEASEFAFWVWEGSRRFLLTIGGSSDNSRRRVREIPWPGTPRLREDCTEKPGMRTDARSCDIAAVKISHWTITYGFQYEPGTTLFRNSLVKADTESSRSSLARTCSAWSRKIRRMSPMSRNADVESRMQVVSWFSGRRASLSLKVFQAIYIYWTWSLASHDGLILLRLSAVHRAEYRQDPQVFCQMKPSGWSSRVTALA